ncbi:hypothetical protein Tco_0668386 [Tanacetum coccineum]
MDVLSVLPSPDLHCGRGAAVTTILDFDLSRLFTRSILESNPKEDDEDPEEDPVNSTVGRDDDDEDEEEEPSKDDVMIRRRKRTRMRRRRRSTQLRPTLYTIPSRPLPVSPPASVLPASPPVSPIRPLGYRAAMIRLRAETPSTSHLLPLPTSSPPLFGEGSSAAAARPTGGRRADYGFVGTMDTEIRRQRAEELTVGVRLTSEMLQADHRRQAEIAALQHIDRTVQESCAALTLMQVTTGHGSPFYREGDSTAGTRASEVQHSQLPEGGG